MKLIIDIDEDRYDEIHSLKFVMYGLQSEENRKLFYRLINAVQDGIPIPDNATNGDVTKAMFPFYNFEIYEHEGYVMVFYADFYTTYPLRWWNALYQKEGDKE